MRFIDYALIVGLLAIVGLALASLLGVNLGPLDPVEAITRAMEAVG